MNRRTLIEATNFGRKSGHIAALGQHAVDIPEPFDHSVGIALVRSSDHPFRAFHRGGPGRLKRKAG